MEELMQKVTNLNQQVTNLNQQVKTVTDPPSTKNELKLVKKQIELRNARDKRNTMIPWLAQNINTQLSENKTVDEWATIDLESQNISRRIKNRIKLLQKYYKDRHKASDKMEKLKRKLKKLKRKVKKKKKKVKKKKRA